MVKVEIEIMQLQTKECQKLSVNYQTLEEVKKDPLL